MPLGVRTLSSSTSHSPSPSRTRSSPAIPIQTPSRGPQARQRRLDVLGAVEHPLRQHALGDDPPLRVDVGDERVQRRARAGRGRPRSAPTRRPSITRGTGSTCQLPSPSTDSKRIPRASISSRTAARQRAQVVREHRVHHRPRGRADAAVRRHRVVERGRAVTVERAHDRRLPARSRAQTRHTASHRERPAELAVVLATVQDFADRGGAERVVVLLDAEPPLMVERREDGALEVTEGEQARAGGAAARRRAAAAGRAAAGAGERADAPTRRPASWRRRSGRCSCSSTRCGRWRARSAAAPSRPRPSPTRDPGAPLTVAAREGEPVVLDIAGRHFTFPG